MIRTQIQLEEKQAAALKRLAATRGISVAALIREAVDETVVSRDHKKGDYRRALAVVGKFRSGRKDVGAKHDEYFVEAALER